MIFNLTPFRLWFLFSVAGYTKAEIQGLTHWSPNEIDEKIALWSLPWWNDIGSRGEIRDRIELLRSASGADAALEAIDKFLRASDPSKT